MRRTCRAPLTTTRLSAVLVARSSQSSQVGFNASSETKTSENSSFDFRGGVAFPQAAGFSGFAAGKHHGRSNGNRQAWVGLRRLISRGVATTGYGARPSTGSSTTATAKAAAAAARPTKSDDTTAAEKKGKRLGDDADDANDDENADYDDDDNDDDDGERSSTSGAPAAKQSASDRRLEDLPLHERVVEQYKLSYEAWEERNEEIKHNQAALASLAQKLDEATRAKKAWQKKQEKVFVMVNCLVPLSLWLCFSVLAFVARYSQVLDSTGMVDYDKVLAEKKKRDSLRRDKGGGDRGGAVSKDTS